MNIYIDIDRNEVVLSPTSNSRAALPSFAQGDSMDMTIWLLDMYSNFAYRLVPVAGITLQVALGDKAGTYYTQQFSWTPSADLSQPNFSATFPMNTAAIDTLVDGKLRAAAYFEIKKVISSVPVTVFQRRVIIEAAVITPTSLTVPAGLTPLSAEAANAAYLGRTVTGEINIINGTTGKGFRLYADEDGAPQMPPIT